MSWIELVRQESPLRIVATISFEQFKAAISAMRKKYRQQAKKWSWKSILSIFLVSFGLVIAIQTSRTEIVEFFFVSVMLLFLLNFWLKWRADYCLKKIFDVQKNQLNGQIMDIDESGISGQWQNGNASYQYKWSAFENFLDLPDAFLFLPNSVSFVRVPKESLSSDDQEDIKRWGKILIARPAATPIENPPAI